MVGASTRHQVLAPDGNRATPRHWRRKQTRNMSKTDRRAPLPVIASHVEWTHRATGTTTPAVRITGPRGTIYVGADDLPQLATAVHEAIAAGQVTV